MSTRVAPSASPRHLGVAVVGPQVEVDTVLHDLVLQVGTEQQRDPAGLDDPVHVVRLCGRTQQLGPPSR
jgi:hypothetical protein